jgi:hypothetical protein
MDAFVTRESVAWKNIAEDGWRWVDILPPSDQPLERWLPALTTLKALLAEAEDAFGICHIRARPLYACLDTISDEELSDAAHLADYLQLPTILPLRIKRNVAAAALRNSSAALYPSIRGCALLAPLLEAAVELVKRRCAPWLLDLLANSEGGAAELALLSGLCGDELAAHGLEASGPPAARLAGLAAANHPLPDLGTAIKASMQLPAIVAASCGRVEGLQALRSAGWAFSTAAVEAAARCGELSALRYMCEDVRIPTVDSQVCVAAAQGGHMHVLRYCAEELRRPWRSPHDGRCCAAAAARGDLSMLQYLHQRGCPLSGRECQLAGESGNLSMLAWLRSLHPSPPWLFTTASAAAAGQLHVLQWIAEHESQDMVQDPWLCARAAEGGHLHVLRWLRSLQPPCPWTADTLLLAAHFGHHDVADWARANGCPPGDADDLG